MPVYKITIDESGVGYHATVKMDGQTIKRFTDSSKSGVRAQANDFVRREKARFKAKKGGGVSGSVLW